MLPFAYYLLKVMLCSSILFGYYWLALRNKKFHLYNRFYLLASVVLSWLIPLIKINFFEETSQPPQIVKLLTAVAGGDRFVEEAVGKSAFTWDWNVVLMSAFAFISALFAVRLVITVVRIICLISRNPVKRWKQIYFVFTNAKGTPFSFFKYIFWNEEIDLKSPEGEVILKHELVHVQEKHSADKMFLNLVLIAGWYNPVMWLIYKELNMLHEFIADEKAIEDGNAADFAAMLLKAAYPQYSFPLANSFFYSPIKRRLLMLTSSNKTSYSYLRRLAVLPLLSATFILFAFTVKKAKATHRTYNSFRADKFIEPENLTDTEGEKTAALYLQDTTKKKRQVNELKGSINKVEITITDSIKFKTDNTELAKAKKQLKLKDELIILNGNYMSWEDFNKMNVLPPMILSITIYKGEEAVEKYGEKGKNGVIEITTKAAVVQTKAQQKYLEDKQTYEREDKKYSEDQLKYKAFINFSDTGSTRPAQFPGGIEEWRKYFFRNTNFSALAKHPADVGKYTVVVAFVISKDGRITDVTAETKTGYGTEEEAVRTISKGPKWQPAKKDGVFADTKVKQTITYTVTKEGWSYVEINSIIVGNVKTGFLTS